jgi:hypothetical protein
MTLAFSIHNPLIKWLSKSLTLSYVLPQSFEKRRPSHWWKEHIIFLQQFENNTQTTENLDNK